MIIPDNSLGREMMVRLSMKQYWRLGEGHRYPMNAEQSAKGLRTDRQRSLL